MPDNAVVVRLVPVALALPRRPLGGVGERVALRERRDRLARLRRPGCRPRPGRRLGRVGVGSAGRGRRRRLVRLSGRRLGRQRRLRDLRRVRDAGLVRDARAPPPRSRRSRSSAATSPSAASPRSRRLPPTRAHRRPTRKARSSPGSSCRGRPSRRAPGRSSRSVTGATCVTLQEGKASLDAEEAKGARAFVTALAGAAHGRPLRAARPGRK